MLFRRALLIAALAAIRVLATAGLAEWEIKTPGGNLISHVDPYIASHGTCLRSGVKPETIYVARLEWWRTYRGAVAGQAKQGFFLFNETGASVRYFETAAALNAAIQQQRLGAPTSPQMTPSDGWRQVWRPILAERCKQLEASAAGGRDMPAAGVQELCSQFKPKR